MPERRPIFQDTCKIYASAKIEAAQLRRKLANYRKETRVSGVDKPLIDNVEEFEGHRDGATFEFLYDFTYDAPYRQESQRVLGTNSATVRVIDPPARNAYIIYSASGIADEVSSKLGAVLLNNAGALQPVLFSSELIRSVLAADKDDVKFERWEDVDANTQNASLGGNVESSQFYNPINQRGHPTVVIYQSASLDRAVRITSMGIITVYGKGVNHEIVEEYISSQIFPHVGL